ncbi:PepSY domain-containing protein [Novosphingobium sp.]|uniref:PepSY domain-containing protein n=1 Tax=Novosphingobium sp. TaxID=1874826 RepID=UPI0035B2509C
MKNLLALLIVPAVFAAVPADAGPGGEQGQARKEFRAGNVRSLREIEQKVLPMMAGAQYLGPEYDPAALAYRLKFIRDGRVIFVDVDARTGDIIRQTR